MNRFHLEFAAASTDLEAAHNIARSLQGTLYCDEREEWRHLPFRALVTAATDTPSVLADIADVGLYVVCRRLIRPGACAVIGLFPLVRNPQLNHEESDAHWRDSHAPLALEHHAYMTHYTQLSVTHRVSGAELDGFALCGFDSMEDLRERFYTRPASREVIAADVAKFADTRRSPRRLIVVQKEFGPEISD